MARVETLREEGQAIAQKLGNGVGYYGPWLPYGPEGEFMGHFFQDDAVTETSFVAFNYEKAKAILIQSRKDFGAEPPVFKGNPGGGSVGARTIAEEAAVKAVELQVSNIAHQVTKELSGELPSDHELLFHFGIEEAGSPGAVLNEATAKASPCSCFTYKGKDLCWSKGVVGLLAQDQQRLYCVAGKTYKAQPALTERYTRFAEAAEAAHKKIVAMPKGMPRLEAWLSAMGEELSKKGIEV
ncbi:hypothetical protein KKH23_06900 [Patescibacteria group bacterium]|uniref:Uncharacterized protein n=1 Tax=viral metagenome TaxID=1070528 RepID=A0A6M3LTB6_9ZZZZ|nr:hypothetical protein [Patescibacteria group bacterium]